MIGTVMLKNMFNGLLHARTEREMMEEYLADSISLEDLERRQRLINRGEAPWQVSANHNLKGWI
jgi:hypothetical protein